MLGLVVSMAESTEDSGSLRVVRVQPGGPAAKAGVKIGDLVSEINGKPCNVLSDLDIPHLFEWVKAGDKVSLKVEREASTVDVVVEAIEMPSEAVARQHGQRELIATSHARELLVKKSTASALVIKVRKIGADSLELEADGLSRETLERIEPLFRSPPYDRFVTGLDSGAETTLRFSWDPASSKMDVDSIGTSPGGDASQEE
ncbi:MAG: PDZ domain-containing protein [bacterium]|nr:PDZ domain-containing protein [bacterium]